MSSGDKIAARSYNLEEVKKYKKMENKENKLEKNCTKGYDKI